MNIKYHYIPYPYPAPLLNEKNIIEEELIRIRKELDSLKKRIEILENNKENNYSQKDIGMYMI